MEAIRLETTVETDGIVSVAGVKAGERIEVIVLRLDVPLSAPYPLRGTRALRPSVRSRHSRRRVELL